MEPVTAAIVTGAAALLLLSRKSGTSGVPSVVKSPFEAAPAGALSASRGGGFVTVEEARAQASAHGADQVRRIEAFKSAASALIPSVDAVNAARLRRGIKAADRWLSRPLSLRMSSPAASFERLLDSVRSSLSGASGSSGPSYGGGTVDKALGTVDKVVDTAGDIVSGAGKVVDAFGQWFGSGSAPDAGDPMDGKG